MLEMKGVWSVDILNWWLTWPTWLQDISVIWLALIFLSHAPGAARWPRGSGPKTSWS